MSRRIIRAMVCASEGDDPKDTNHIQLRTMIFQLFDQKKTQYKELKKWERTLVTRAAFSYLNQDDAVEVEAEAGPCGQVFIDERIDGSWRNETIEINQKVSYRGHDVTHYDLSIFAGGGRDTIIINHENTHRRPRCRTDEAVYRSSVEVRGGEGIDTFIDNSQRTQIAGGVGFQIKDMEIGEKLITHPENNEYMRSEEWNNGKTKYSIGATPYSGFHTVVVDEGAKLELTFNAEGNAVYMCVPENW